ncbi:MAG: UDP-glucose/GDP-mannose dehydrogenase family protein [Candidatus Atribacteria bacterium]|nr:UDP-glucose/GDP-mannose dehydrogenase family protein [Candidatus Atribacteria bacterium]
MKKITVVGAGYVGLVTAICFADLGNDVVCIEKDDSKLNQLSRGILTFYEPGIPELLQKNLGTGKVRFTNSMSEGVAFGDVIFLCVGTPERGDGSADLSQIENASREIASSITSYRLIVEKSTVPVNTHQRVKRTIQRYAGHDVPCEVASNPEFLREGSALEDFMHPDRIIIGVESQRGKALFQEIYQDFSCPIIYTDPATAELVKHASNSFLAMKISYINMIADLCEKVGADISIVADGVGFDKRIGRSFLNPGIGWGGSCFGKDVKAFIEIAEEYGVHFGLLQETLKQNYERRKSFVRKIEDILWVNNDKVIAIWGLSFKPDTDDIRDAPSIEIVRELLKNGAQLQLFDPVAMDNFRILFPESDKVHYLGDKYDACQGADTLVILTEWKEFQSIDWPRLKKSLNLPVIVDGRNLFKPEYVRGEGFEYYSVGRK